MKLILQNYFNLKAIAWTTHPIHQSYIHVATGEILHTGCKNDDSVVDELGDTCSSFYDAKPEFCGRYDTDEFVAADLCCACMA